MYKERLKPYFYLLGLYLAVSFLLRIVFIFHPITTSGFTMTQLTGMILAGMFGDILIFTIFSSIFTLYTLFLSNQKFGKPQGIIILSLLILAMLYVSFVPNNIFKQYGGSVETIVLIFLGIKTCFFGLMLLLPKYRAGIRSILYFFTLFLFVLVIILNSVSEYFFWNEFGVRYNFIAVDYLIYTNEVIGNILESYPVFPLFSVMLLASFGLTWYIFKKTKSNLVQLPDFGQKMKLLLAYIVLFAASLWLIKPVENYQNENNFVTEIRSNGLYKFYYAFTHSELDFFQFYSTLPVDQAEKLYLSQFQLPEFPRKVVSDSTELHKNVVLISIESLSAEFLEHYGNKNNITPFLDSLANHSIMFTNLYATGNRTVRGLEALTLCIPPTPGESIVKRKDNKNKFTIGGVFKSKGYQVKYLYGGYSYFDNMEDFFKGNGYEIVDRSNFKPEEISFANVWGVADEDMAKKAIQVMNEEHKSGKPFFNHWMTVSNHRPFTYPEGRIDIPGNSRSRDGGVKYTDYSLRLFFELAAKEPWFENTIFVVVADHCASSAGKTDLPLDKYRIPAIVFSADKNFQPKKFNGLMSQIDLMPTVFGMLNFSYTSKFLGQDVFSSSYKPRAYIATYQDLGYLKDGYLSILSPVRKIVQNQFKQKQSDLPEEFRIYYDEIVETHPNKNLTDEATATYETVSSWLKSGRLDN